MSLTSATSVPVRLGSTPDDYARIGMAAVGAAG
jgi:hypothetical protein